jgi:TBC1 domain family member 23
MSDSDEEFNDEEIWQTELEIALLTKCDYGTLRSIAKLRPIPDTLRSKVWKICLNIDDDSSSNEKTGDVLSKWSEIYDLPQQDKIREDCQNLAIKLLDGDTNDNDKQLEMTSRLEAIITFYCKKNNENYERDNGWLELLYPIMSLNLTDQDENFNFFNAILKRYIPSDCVQNGSPYHLFRLLMLYHDPELCAFLDTKKISPDSYAHSWFRSLFSSKNSIDVIFTIWDLYLQLADQFLLFFIPFIIVYNIRDKIIKDGDRDKSEIINLIHDIYMSLGVDDIKDLNTLCQHFARITPQSFRKVNFIYSNYNYCFPSILFIN